MNTRKIFVIVSMILFAAAVSAQPQGDGRRPAPPKRKTPEEIAKTTAQAMVNEIGISEKQYKKVYKLIKKDQEYRRSQAQNQFGGGMPPQGGPGMGGPGGMNGQGGMGGPGMGGFGGGMMGGGPGMGGGMPPQGMGSDSGMGGGMPPQGMGNGQRPQGGPGMGPGEDLVTEEYLEKQDKKLKKILTEEQYTKWRSKHPAEHLSLPPVSF